METIAIVSDRETTDISDRPLIKRQSDRPKDDLEALGMKNWEDIVRSREADAEN